MVDKKPAKWIGSVDAPSFEGCTTTTSTDISPTISIDLNPDPLKSPLSEKKITPKKPKLNKGGCSICDDPDCPANKGDIEIQPKKPKLKIKTYQVEQLNIKAREKERLIIDDGLFEIIRKI